jgi:hypothetical protein
MSAEDVRRLLANSAASPRREVDVGAILRNGADRSERVQLRRLCWRWRS